MPNTELWIVGKVKPEEYPHAWEFQGVFSSRKLATEACRTPRYFVAPATLDATLPDETFEWPGLVFPPLEELVSG